jgi:hypothetical protein
MSGFVYDFECVDANGNVKWTETVHNIIPADAMNYILSSALNNASRYTTWYVGIYANNYTPVTGETMTTLLANASEVVSYTESTREAFVPDAIVNGLFANYTAPAEFTFSGTATIRGGFICSDATKNSAAGLLLSAALFASPRTVADGETLKVRGGLQLVSV